MFQSTLPRRERRGCLGRENSQKNGFNPRSHEGSDTKGVSLPKYFIVSIHAPTKGATDRLPSAAAGMDGFNPRSHEGSDRTRSRSCSSGNGFNPRSHEGSDPPNWCTIYPFIVSIHAPTKGATSTARTDCFGTVGFNPRSHEGSDSAASFPSNVVRVSIHAPTKGATGTYAFNSVVNGSFNPRSHEGSDGIPELEVTNLWRFQSTLPRRERRKRSNKR